MPGTKDGTGSAERRSDSKWVRFGIFAGGRIEAKALRLRTLAIFEMGSFCQKRKNRGVSRQVLGFGSKTSAKGGGATGGGCGEGTRGGMSAAAQIMADRPRSPADEDALRHGPKVGFGRIGLDWAMAGGRWKGGRGNLKAQFSKFKKIPSAKNQTRRDAGAAAKLRRPSLKYFSCLFS